MIQFAFYRFLPIADLEATKEMFLEKSKSLGLRGSILLAREGINANMSGKRADYEAFRAWLDTVEGYEGLSFKETDTNVYPFRRMLVKIKNEIIPMDGGKIDPNEYTGKRLEPKDLKRWYDEGKKFRVLDTRNIYEFNTGHFKNSEELGIHTFKEFPEALKSWGEDKKDETVVMFCTGGIRCEKATALAMDYGFKDVYQVEGGILRYFEEVGGDHWEGDCFVFDNRFLVGPDLKSAATAVCVRCRDPYPEMKISSWSEAPPCPHCGMSDDAFAPASVEAAGGEAVMA